MAAVMAAATWKLTVRSGSKVERERFASLEEAAARLRVRVDELRPAARRETTHAFLREIEPGEQVPARLELRGPGRRAGGVDLRGDGSAAAWTGRISKRVVEAERGEDPVAALTRALAR
jgi:hypothetical protein